MYLVKNLKLVYNTLTNNVRVVLSSVEISLDILHSILSKMLLNVNFFFYAEKKYFENYVHLIKETSYFFFASNNSPLVF